MNGGNPGIDPTETFRATLRVENVYYGGKTLANGTKDSVMGMTGVEVTGAKVRFAVLTELGATATTRDFVDNSDADSDKRPGYFNVPLPLVGQSVKATVLSVPSPWTTVGAVNPPVATIKGDFTAAVGKLLVNRLPRMGVGFLVDGTFGLKLSYGYTVTGPNGFYKSGTAIDFVGFSALPTDGWYRTCETSAPAGYVLTTRQCVDWLVAYNGNGGPTFNHAKL
jgi:hypothetical protein